MYLAHPRNTPGSANTQHQAPLSLFQSNPRQKYEQLFKQLAPNSNDGLEKPSLELSWRLEEVTMEKMSTFQFQFSYSLKRLKWDCSTCFMKLFNLFHEVSNQLQMSWIYIMQNVAQLFHCVQPAKANLYLSVSPHHKNILQKPTEQK